MTKIISRLIGGAGTGKTTELMNIMARLLESTVRDPLQIGFCSFTRAARSEAVTRAAAQFGLAPDLLEREGWFKTLHSVCYRCLGVDSTQLLSGNKKSNEWLTEALQERVETTAELGGDVTELAFSADSNASRALNCWSAARNRLAPLETVWREAQRCDERMPSLEYCRELVERYEMHKRLDKRLDFVDLLGQFVGLKFTVDGPVESLSGPRGDVPGIPVWFFDEQQDTSLLLDKVCHRLIENPSVRAVYVVGDPFQSIFAWAGADSRCFMAWPADRERIMPKSYRCPAPVLALGEQTLKRCSNYFDRGIAPADHEGSINTEWTLSYLDGLSPLDDTLVIARTNHQANRLAHRLESAGIPWVPTRGRGGWAAPVRNQGLGGLYAIEKRGPVSGQEWVQILKLLPSKSDDGQELLTRGTKSRFAEPDEASKYPWVLPHELEQLGATPALVELVTSGRWRHTIKDAARTCAALDRWGTEVLTSPKIRVGTIHSVKGQEAEKVVLLTTTSGAVKRQEETSDGFDEERRVEYVAQTRARRELVLLREGSATNFMECGI